MKPSAVRSIPSVKTVLIFAAGAVAGSIVTSVVRLIIGPGVAGPWLQLIGASVAAAAFLLALHTFNFNRLKSKSDLFNLMHAKLLDSDIQLGRAHLSSLSDAEAVKDLESEIFRLINRAIAHYDTLAMYALKGDVVLQDVIETWGVAMHQRTEKIRWFIQGRTEMDGYASWPHLRQLLDHFEMHPPRDTPGVRTQGAA